MSAKPIVWAVLPARYGSTRFPGKPLQKIQGRELISWVIAGALQSKLCDAVVVATDDERIAEVAVQNGVRAVMTDSQIPSGTDRIWAAIRNEKVDIVLNVQGDEPLTTGALIDSLVTPMLQDADLQMATLAHSLSAEELGSLNAVKVVVNARDEALYFSRFPIPYSREKPPELPASSVLKHIGMYAFRVNFLQKFCAASPGELELAESLEQLRALHLGARIKVIRSKDRSWGVDTPADISTIEKILAQRGS